MHLANYPSRSSPTNFGDETNCVESNSHNCNEAVRAVRRDLQCEHRTPPIHRLSTALGYTKRRAKLAATCFHPMRHLVIAFLLLPFASLAREPSIPVSPAPFILTEGRGLPVCDAYLEVLNRMPLERTPFCGRPDNGPNPDFVPLKRHDLSAEEIMSLFTYVWEFMRFDDPRHEERYAHPQLDPSKSFWSANPTDLDTIEKFLRFGWLNVWSYSAPIDIENDGNPIPLVIWQGYGATSKGADCGTAYPHVWTDSYIEQRAFVLSTDGKTIDEGRTRAIFGAPANGAPKSDFSISPPVHTPGLPIGATPFHEIGDSIGIFGYRAKYYFQTENMPISRTARPSPVKVFLRQNGQTNEVCAFRPESVPIPPQYPNRPDR